MPKVQKNWRNWEKMGKIGKNGQEPKNGQNDVKLSKMVKNYLKSPQQGLKLPKISNMVEVAMNC